MGAIPSFPSSAKYHTLFDLGRREHFEPWTKFRILNSQRFCSSQTRSFFCVARSFHVQTLCPVGRQTSFWPVAPPPLIHYTSSLRLYVKKGEETLEIIVEMATFLASISQADVLWIVFGWWIVKER
jgi:hypothetical protein